MLKFVNKLVFFSVLLVISACSSLPKQVPINEGLKKQLDGFQVRSVIFFDGQGNIVVTDADGKGQKPCTVEPGKKQCRALGKGAEVLSINAVTVITGKVNPNCVATVDATGFASEICW